jgi:plastocyanin
LRLRISRLLPVGLALLLGLLGVAGYAFAANLVVTLTANGPQPKTSSATLGDTVTFVNGDSATHTVVDRQTGLQSPPLAPGQSFAYVLTRSGKLTYQQEGRPQSSGEINVTRAGSVTLRASKRSIAYRSSSILSGISSFPIYPVKIEQRTKADRRWTDVATVTPAPDGSFTLAVNPGVNTEYRADVFSGELLSPSIDVGVRPILTLTAGRRTAPAGSLLTLTTRMVPAEAANSIDLTVFDSKRQRWRRVLTRNTSTGKVIFRWRVEFGRSVLRASLSKRGLARGVFAQASSRSVVVTGTGTPPRKHRRR